MFWRAVYFPYRLEGSLEAWNKFQRFLNFDCVNKTNRRFGSGFVGSVQWWFLIHYTILKIYSTWRKNYILILTFSLYTFIDGEKPSFLVLRTGSLLERYLLHSGARKVGLTVSGSFSVAKPDPDAVEVTSY
jgi:hypothetical protein